MISSTASSVERRAARSTRPCSSSCFGIRYCLRDRRASPRACSRGSRGSPCGRGAAAGSGRATFAVATNITLREVERDLEVVVGERVVLLGVEHLEQRRRGIAAEVVPDLVDLVEHEDRVVRPGLLHALDDPAGQRADVGAAVAADLGLVVHAAERDADELAAERARRSSGRATSCRRRAGRPGRGSGPSCRSSACARPGTRGCASSPSRGRSGPRRGSSRAAWMSRLSSVVDRPRQIDDPVEVGAHDRVLGRADLHHLQALELLVRDLLGLGRQVGLAMRFSGSRRDRRWSRRSRRALP